MYDLAPSNYYARFVCVTCARELDDLDALAAFVDQAEII